MAWDRDKACELIADGLSLREAGAILGCSATAICSAAVDDPEFGLRYARAMELRADYHASRIEELADKVEQGQIPPDQARVAIDARKWTAAKLRPKRYGDRTHHDVDATVRVEIADPAKQLRKP